MKKQFKNILLFFALFAVLSAHTVCNAFAAYEELQVVEVIGTGAVLAKADMATIHFCIETTAKSDSEARKANNEIYEELKASGSDLGILSEESFCSYQDPDRGTVTLTRCLTLKTEKIDSVSKAVDVLMANGATGIHYIGYSLKDPAKFQQEALQKAVEDARKKAEALGVSLKLSELREMFNGYCGEDCRPEIWVSCDVTLVYAGS